MKYKKGDKIYLSRREGLKLYTITKVGLNTSLRRRQVCLEGLGWTSIISLISTSDTKVIEMIREKEELRKNIITIYKAEECGLCSRFGMEGGDDASKEALINELYREGWRVIEHKEYQAIFLTCPECIEEVRANDSTRR